MSQIQLSAIRNLEVVVQRQEVPVYFCNIVISLCVRFNHCAKYCFSFKPYPAREYGELQIMPASGKLDLIRRLKG